MRLSSSCEFERFKRLYPHLKAKEPGRQNLLPPLCPFSRSNPRVSGQEAPFTTQSCAMDPSSSSLVPPVQSGELGNESKCLSVVSYKAPTTSISDRGVVGGSGFQPPTAGASNPPATTLNIWRIKPTELSSIPTSLSRGPSSCVPGSWQSAATSRTPAASSLSPPSCR